MSENDEPFDNTPREEDTPTTAIGEPLPAPLATADQGRDGGKTNCRATTKSFFEIESD